MNIPKKRVFSISPEIFPVSVDLGFQQSCLFKFIEFKADRIG
jgi:hypothetical protein